MPQAQTRFFGQVPFDEESVLRFPFGLPGFEAHDRFLALNRPGTEPVVFLQSLLDEGLCFVTVPVMAIEPGYRLCAAPEDLEALHLSGDANPSAADSGTLCLAILTLSADGTATANLMSPVLINLEAKCGMQVIQADTDYSHRHPLDRVLAGATCS